MEFEKLLEDINKKIVYFCKKYDFWDKKDELLSESFICFKKCKEKFNGDKEEFKFYFLRALSNHFLNFYKMERKFENHFLFFENFKEIEKGIEREMDLIYKLNSKLSEEEIFILDLKISGFKLKEIISGDINAVQSLLGDTLLSLVYNSLCGYFLHISYYNNLVWI